jgi:DNA-directed RNA polymerase subunit RPC12/RpoP
MSQCPECGGRRFVSKLLVYEVTSYDEGGEREFRRQHVRAEFEYTCSECQATLRTLPADRRDYYDEVQVLEAERRAALRDQLRQLCGQVGRRAWATKSWITLVLLTVTVAVLWL